MGRSRQTGMWAAAAWLAMSIVAAAGCVEEADPVKPVDRQAIARWVGTKPTAPTHKFSAKLGDQLELIGYDIKSGALQAGETFTVVWHWKTNKALGSGWHLFTHLADSLGADKLNQDNVGVIRRAYPPGEWLRGEYVRDEQRIKLPADWNSPTVTFFVGAWKGPKRLPVTAGPHDGDHRVRVVTVPVAAPKSTPLPELVSMRTTTAPTLDGKLDEEIWKKAAQTERFVNTLTGKPAQPTTRVRSVWDDDNVYLAFTVEDSFLKSGFDSDDDHLWKEDCVEVMVDPNGDGLNYFELQVSPRGKVFDTRYDSRRKPGPFGHTDWNAGVKAGVDTRGGTVNDDEPDKGYTVEMALPWKAFAAGATPAAKPKAGDTWRMNFYVLDTRQKGQRGAGWSPPRVRDFHVPPRFGKIRFVDAAAAAAKPPAVAAGSGEEAKAAEPSEAAKTGQPAKPGSKTGGKPSAAPKP